MEKPRKNRETNPDRERDKEIEEVLEKIAVPFEGFVEREKEKTKELKELTPEEKKDLLDLLKKELEKEKEK